MQDYSMVSQIIVTSSYEEVNAMLRDCWRLLDIFHDENGYPIFVLGDKHDVDMQEFMRNFDEGGLNNGQVRVADTY